MPTTLSSTKTFSTLLIASTLLFACKNGNHRMTTVNASVSDFKAIHISYPADVTIHVVPGATPSVVLKGKKDIVDNIKTEVLENVLSIDGKQSFKNLFKNNSITAEITVASLNEIQSTGAGDIHIKGVSKFDNLDITLTGASDLKADDITAKKINVTVSGAGDINFIGGKVGSAQYTLSGAGDIKAVNLVTDSVSAQISGAGDASFDAEQYLEVSISGAGSVKYKGNPKIVKDVSGAGSIHAISH